MSTAVLAPAVAASRPLRRRRRLEHPYPLFGFRQQVHRLPLVHRYADIDRWLLHQFRLRPREAWPARWQRCQQEQRSWFKEVWTVRLPRRSRALSAGDYVFDPMADFLHIPGTPPAAVRDCYDQAFAELPRHRFVYLDLLWEPTPTGLQLLSVERLLDKVSQLEQRFRQRLRNERLLIEAAQARQRELIATLRAEQRALAETIPLPSTPAEARRILGLSDDAFQRSLERRVKSIEFAKYDPVIVFEEPALLRRAAGRMPLGLVAHWD